MHISFIFTLIVCVLCHVGYDMCINLKNLPFDSLLFRLHSLSEGNPGSMKLCSNFVLFSAERTTDVIV